jgi:hypothetical protein
MARDFGHAGVQRHRVLDLVREHLEARHHDQVLLAVGDAEAAPVVEARCRRCAASRRGEGTLGGLVGPLPVALHDLRAAHADLAGFAAGRSWSRSSRMRTCVDGSGSPMVPVQSLMSSGLADTPGEVSVRP